MRTEQQQKQKKKDLSEFQKKKVTVTMKRNMECTSWSGGAVTVEHIESEPRPAHESRFAAPQRNIATMPTSRPVNETLSAISRVPVKRVEKGRRGARQRGAAARRDVRRL